MGSFRDRLQHAWNAFTGKDTIPPYSPQGYSTSFRPDRPRFSRGNERTVVTAVLNRMAMDASAIEISHVRVDDEDRYLEDIDSGLNECLTLSANLDQTGRAFIQDVVMSMFDEGCVAIIPVETSVNPRVTGSYDIHSLRTGKILEWRPEMIRTRVYNEKIGRPEDIWVMKNTTAIVENPLYSVMNEPNSTLQRLMRKLVLLDAVDEQTGSGKLDLIIQLPYVIKTDARRVQAENRRQDIERQLSGSKYGIAYTDGTEKIVQLNRSLENNLMGQIEYLTSMLYSQLGITQAVLDGSANEEEMNNYYTRIIEPVLSAITDEMKRKFLTKTARTQGQSIKFFRDPFKLMPTSNIAEIADKFTRNEIMSSNEIRQIVGMKPSKDPAADELRNKNLNQSVGQQMGTEMLAEEEEMSDEDIQSSIDDLDALDRDLDDLEKELG